MWPPTPMPGRCARCTVTAAFQRIQRAVAALDLLVAGEVGLVLGRDRVDVVGRRDHRHAQVQILRALEQAEHDLAAAAVALRGDELLERLLPLGGLVGIAVEGALGVRILVVDSHVRPFVVWQIVPGNRIRSGTAFVRPCTTHRLPA